MKFVMAAIFLISFSAHAELMKTGVARRARDEIGEMSEASGCYTNERGPRFARGQNKSLRHDPLLNGLRSHTVST